MTGTASAQKRTSFLASGTQEHGSAGDDRSNPAAVALLQLQAEMRKLKSLAELGYFVANEGRAPLHAQQIIIFDRGTHRKLTVQAVSSLTSVERASPLVCWLESAISELGSKAGLENVQEFDAAAFAGEYRSIQAAYPLQHFLWVPWPDSNGAPTSGMLLARASPWTAQNIRIAQYLGGAFGHAWHALARPRALNVAWLLSRRALAGLTLAGLALLLAPVPMTALAPVEVVPRETYIVTPGIEGVTTGVHVEPNARVSTGQLLVTLNDTVLRNRAEIAEREVLLAQSKYKKAAQLAFHDARGRHEMAIARSDLDLKLAERDYARELLARTRILAERDGVAFFADRKDLIGKPVAIGEKLMEVANPGAAELRIDLAAADAIVIRDGARVKVFLDTDPLGPIEARLVRAAYKAAPREAQQFAFRLVAELENPQKDALRLGARGTAQVFSDQVSLGFYLFRRPLAAVRQWLGI